MEIRPTDSSELATREYHAVEAGRVYHCPGRLVIIQADESALLILTEPTAEK